ncbi:ExbD/TolR family protein [Fusobacterium nucleatum]|uniref:Biopolymer transporter ExbD n=1 Tax=Fusobacterium nucleatum subsp. nucleatum TaxID=76856 RepID=A0A0M3UXB5_FUSNC|nr:biopolymer transporter ExbD [Fusobacterium nucleatum]ALF23594.1 biopolymer transporter ExbD [Fusobacterium nucleatum subsp. nucleatum ChDC F316]ALF26543.1 biopolymer transporter ExbD [Fusobacterium nucleatum subsp. nucleatum]ASG27038.1 biopolymer transporter ExbD [Fusobacterium nucleatum subsp. nucleatum]KUL97755.1 biopolymer transporter ExbD [Fusobacterium nucleatum subsp. nucleatum]MCG6842194.1 biopolymer transporter ExbD [Fusobacterium nucleatum]
MKLERIKRRSGGALILEITPLIDVVFLLLIFFMLATSFDERSAFKIDLPKSTAAKTKSTLKEVQVLVDKDRNVYLRYTDNSGKSQNEKLDLTSFVSVVSEKLNNSENKDVIISADKDIDYGFIVEIMSLLKESGASAINIDTAIKSR